MTQTTKKRRKTPSRTDYAVRKVGTRDRYVRKDAEDLVPLARATTSEERGESDKLRDDATLHFEAEFEIVDIRGRPMSTNARASKKRTR